MKVLLGLIICICALYGSVNAEKYQVLNATAIVRGLPLRRFFDRWNPKGLQPFTEFIYTIITDPDKTIKIHCPAINLHEPCEQYSMDIIDGNKKKRICGRVRKFFYDSTTSKVDFMIRTGPKLVKMAPKCTARVIKRH